MNTLPAVCLALALAAPGPKEPKKDPPTIVGEWIIADVKLGGGGLALPVQSNPTKTMYAADGKFENRLDGEEKPYQSGTYTGDPKKDPPEIDLTDAAVPGVVTPGIYKIDGDTLTIGLGRPGARPTSFDDNPLGGSILYVYKRAKKK
jgi:uncharacterized protein (TIGR03067 family)